MSYDNHDRMGEILAGPTKDEVLKQFSLPDLFLTVQELSPMDAFKEFMDYAKTAIGRKFSLALYGALRRDAYAANERLGKNGVGGVFPSLTDHQENANGRIMRHELSARFAPLLPAIREYISQRPQDPAMLNRLAWLADQVEIVNAQDYPLHGFPRLGCTEWRALKKGISDTITNLPTALGNPVELAPTATKGTPERLPWTSTTSAFAHIFTTLSNAGYFPIPRRGGKENEPNFTGFARVLLQAFDVKGEDGNSLTVEQLRVRLRPSAPRPLPETKTAKFQIPDKGILIVPNADEME